MAGRLCGGVTPDLVLLDERGSVVAREGETVYVGGGAGMRDGQETFRACGSVSTDPP